MPMEPDYIGQSAIDHAYAQDSSASFNSVILPTIGGTGFGNPGAVGGSGGSGGSGGASAIADAANTLFTPVKFISILVATLGVLFFIIRRVRKL